MSKKNNFVFSVLHVVAWVIFVGLCVEAGAILVNFVFAIFNPAVVDRLYQKLDLSEMYRQSQWVFFGMYSFIIFISVLKALLFYMVIELLMKLDLSNPFTHFVTKKNLQISYYALSIGILSYIAGQTAKNLSHHGYETAMLNEFWEDGQAFILMAAIIYILAQIFKRGVELQTENDLTV